jgi:hypothetical protein
MEIYQACLDVANHKEALNALKFIAEISGHLGKNKSGPGVSVNIMQQNQGGSPFGANVSSQGTIENNGALLLEHAPGVNLASLSREQRAKERIKQLSNIMDAKTHEMDWVNTNSLSLEDEDVVENE